MKKLSFTLCLCLLALVSCSSGCRQQQATGVADDSALDTVIVEPGEAADAASTQPQPAASGRPSASATAAESQLSPLQTIEIDAAALLAAQLTPEQLAQGWVRLFDGQSLFGWFIVGDAEWQFATDGVLTATRGEPSYLCTSFQIPNYELRLDFRGDADSHSSIFLRTGPQPQDVAHDCLQLSLTAADSEFPTGSLVERQKVEPSELGEFDPSEWHSLAVRVVGTQVSVRLDDKPILELDGLDVAPDGHISLHHESGRIEFRNILLRPLDPTELKLGADWEQDWRLSEKAENTFKATVVDDGLQLTGGLGQLQSKQAYDNFMLQARYTLATPEVNSGIFFRCIPDAMLDGYECQVNHAVADGDPLRAIDAGAGAIFRRQSARIVIGDGSQPTYLTLLANGPQMVSWVNGVQVVDFYDTREPDDNPRKGLRLAAGPIALQGHDETTDVTFQSIAISPFHTE